MALHCMKVSRMINQNAFRCIALSTQRSQSTATNDKLITTEVNSKTGFVTVSFNRPKAHNSFTLEMLQEFASTLDEVDSKNSRGMILTTTSENVFTTGYDIKELVDPDPERLWNLHATYLDCCHKLFYSLFPTAAAINGHAIGGGSYFAKACEYRVILPNCKIGMNETQLGIAIPKTAILTMKNIISAREVEKAVTFGYVYPSEEALKVGLVDEIATDKADAIAKCEAFLLKFRKVPPLARGLTKQYFRMNIADMILAEKQKDVDVFVKSILDPKNQRVFKSFLSR
ncbi:unnamed protein product [Chironomus riparius]|uniref:Enoyl-CoA hydratase n=1 Tax=Chironomus riparius TaxID=315576 RepID=A0A9N9WJ54_9DIPT|nr:unnamed protein product [Chironomus riparius]